MRLGFEELAAVGQIMKEYGAIFRSNALGKILSLRLPDLQI